MTDYNINLTLQSIWTIFRVVIDIGIVWFILYYAIKFVRNNSRTVQIAKGIIAIMVVNFIASVLGLETLAYFSNIFINWGFLAIIIIFQPEIRGVLERIGKSNVMNRMTGLMANEREKLAQEVYEAAILLSKAKVGALISIEQSQSMQDYINTGIRVDAKVSKELLCSIFMTTTPLHDGAVIIQGDKISCASSYFPPTSANLSSRYGARHRAALGIAEVTDALTIVVSEETSAISIAEKGRIFSVDEKQLKDYLRRVICNDEIEVKKESRQRNSLLIDDETPEITIEKEGEASSIFNLFKHSTKSNPKVEEEPEKELDMKIPFNNRAKYENKNIDMQVLEIKDNSPKGENHEEE